MSVINSFFSAFLMYSRIPVPQIEWKEENRRYALCFFPLIGAVCGAVVVGWYYFCGLLDIGDILFSVGCTTIPAIVTGGIHLDGYCDVCDAKASCGDSKRRLEIMKDPHIGAFAAVKLILLLIVQTALFSELRRSELIIICGCGMVFSRALSGFAAASLRNAKNGGLLFSFTKPAHKRATLISCLIFIFLSLSSMILLSPVPGTSAVISGLLSFVYYRFYSYRHYGGITGDLAGYFLQICELSVISGTVLGSRIVEMF